jgi:hypothetical protein
MPYKVFFSAGLLINSHGFSFLKVFITDAKENDPFLINSEGSSPTMGGAVT